MLSQILTFAKFALIYFAVSEANPLVWLGMATAEDSLPPWLAYLKENKMYSVLMIFFTSSAIEGQILSTGAFEIYANGELLFSKIQSGGIPQPQSVVSRIDELFGKTVASDAFNM